MLLHMPCFSSNITANYDIYISVIQYIIYFKTLVLAIKYNCADIHYHLSTYVTMCSLWFGIRPPSLNHPVPLVNVMILNYMLTSALHMNPYSRNYIVDI